MKSIQSCLKSLLPIMSFGLGPWRGNWIATTESRLWEMADCRHGLFSGRVVLPRCRSALLQVILCTPGTIAFLHVKFNMLH